MRSNRSSERASSSDSNALSFNENFRGVRSTGRTLRAINSNFSRFFEDTKGPYGRSGPDGSENKRNNDTRRSSPVPRRYVHFEARNEVFLGKNKRSRSTLTERDSKDETVHVSKSGPVSSRSRENEFSGVVGTFEDHLYGKGCRVVPRSRRFSIHKSGPVIRFSFSAQSREPSGEFLREMGQCRDPPRDHVFCDGFYIQVGNRPVILDLLVPDNVDLVPHNRRFPTMTDKFPTMTTSRSHDGLNPAHVPCKRVNNPTLGEFCFAMIGRADIEGSKSDVAMNLSLIHI